MNAPQRPKFLKPSDSSTHLDKNDAALSETTDFVYNQFISLSLQAQRQRLPIFNCRNHILYLLETFQTLVLVGETGCGKSTQIPQYMIEAKWPGQIGVCEPRRVSAVSLAGRVAEETGTMVQGEMVGYSVRWDTCPTTPKIKFMTEGILIREMMADPLLSSYSAIMLDEVHERTLYTDILMGLMKKILKKRKTLRLIVASATLDAEPIYHFYNNNPGKDKSKDTCVIMTVEGRAYPVESYFLEEPVPNYVQAVVDTVMKIHTNQPQGDVLAFLTGQEEVDTACRLLKDHSRLLEEMKGAKGGLLVVPMYGSLPFVDQLKAFKRAPDKQRKIVVATNVAETSVTIPGIVYVVDCGFVKLRWFNPETHTDSLVVLPISKASADQRAGRAGRTKAGKVYRLYTEADYDKLTMTTPPEIQRSNLLNVVLQLKALGISNVLRFDFLNPPPAKNLLSALEILYAIQGINEIGNLTQPIGLTMAEFALDPIYSKILFSAWEYGCTDQIVSIVAMLQVENIFGKPTSGQGILNARVRKRNFEVEEGDLITLLNIYTGFERSDFAREFCQRNCFSHKALKRVVEIKMQLEKMMKKYKIPVASHTRDVQTICKCLATGLFPNAAYLHHTGVYKTIRGDIELHVHPNSVFYTIEPPQWVLFCEVLQTNKTYMKEITLTTSDWLLEVAPHFYHKVFER